jgi:dissimilatory sulfite reductase related protein
MTSPAVVELVVNGQVILTDEDGYLKNRNDWSGAVAETMSAADGVELTECHWEVIRLLQEYYDNYEIAPAIRILTKAVGKKLGKDKANSRYLYDLYPQGPAKQACRYAGLPKPTGCV